MAVPKPFVPLVQNLLVAQKKVALEPLALSATNQNAQTKIVQAHTVLIVYPSLVVELLENPLTVNFNFALNVRKKR